MQQFDGKSDEAFCKVRSLLAITQPFFGTILLGMDLKQDYSFPTMYTMNGEILGYNPEFFMALNEKHRLSSVAHEVMHPALLHNFRCGDRDRMLWNMAGDYALNLLLEDSGFSIPHTWLIDKKYRDMTTEQIYDDLRNQRDEQGKGPGGGEPGDGDSNNSGMGDGNGDPQDHVTQGYGGGAWKHDSDCGCGYVKANKDGKQNDKAAEVAAATKMKATVAQAAAVAKACGKMPASLQRFVDSILNPQIPWGDHLRDLIEMEAFNDFDWEQADQRYLHTGFYLPSIHNMEMGKIAVSFDTSGSMGDKDLAHGCAEISGILNQLHPEQVAVIYTDADVANVQEITPDEYPINLEPKGGGGTSFVPSFEWVEKTAYDPVCHIYMTDGYCNDFAKEPDHPVFWCVTSGYKGFAPPYGEVLHVNG